MTSVCPSVCSSAREVEVSIQESRTVAEKPRDAAVNFDTYRNLQRHRAVLPAVARLLLYIHLFFIHSSTGVSYMCLYQIALDYIKI